MANIAAYHEWLMKKDIFGLLRRHPVAFPVFVGVGVVPFEADAILEWTQGSHSFSIRLSYTRAAGPALATNPSI
jgi:hypothetical protein